MLDLSEGLIEVYGTTREGASADPAADRGPAPGCTPSTAPGVWYMVTGNGMAMSASTCGSSFDTKLGVYSGGCFFDELRGFNFRMLNCETSNDDFCGAQSRVEWVGEDGWDYYILVHGFESATGDFTLNVTSERRPIPRGDSNDDGRVDLADVVFTLAYLFTRGDVPPCLGSADSNADEIVDITDPVFTLDNLFLGGPEHPESTRCGL